MKQKSIDVLMVEPGAVPKLTKLGNTLDELQKAVSIGTDYQGLIEIITLDDEACILCNEEAKLIGLEPNRRLYSDILYGVFYITGQDKSGNLCSLSAEKLEYYKAYFANPENITREEAENTLVTGFYIL